MDLFFDGSQVRLNQKQRNGTLTSIVDILIYAKSGLSKKKERTKTRLAELNLPKPIEPFVYLFVLMCVLN